MNTNQEVSPQVTKYLRDELDSLILCVEMDTQSIYDAEPEINKVFAKVFEADAKNLLLELNRQILFDLYKGFIIKQYIVYQGVTKFLLRLDSDAYNRLLNHYKKVSKNCFDINLEE